MELTQRDEAVIADVAMLGAMTRDQIWRHRGFRSLTRVNATLLRLVRFEYLSRRTQPTLTGSRRFVYLLGPRGAELHEGPRRPELPVQRVRFREASDLFLEHLLLVNEVRLRFMDAEISDYRLDRWVTDQELRLAALGIIPDAYAEYTINTESFAVFLEADRGTESSSRWNAKVSSYSQLAFSGRYAALFGRQYFRVLVVAPSEPRVAHLRKVIARITERIFWLTTVDAVVQQGPLGVIWQRPSDPTPKALTP